jgi:H+/Cl- antiporter ClcA
LQTLRANGRAIASQLGIGVVVGASCGAASALFLWLLGWATDTRTATPLLAFGLPLAGLALGYTLLRFGKPMAGGSGLVVRTVHASERSEISAIDSNTSIGPTPDLLPHRMAPLVLLGTVLTHLFGGSAGREGTAVQMGASLADAWSRALRWGAQHRHMALVAGVAGGFGSVFGTPIAGLVFALESMEVGRLRYIALVPALVAAVVGDAVTTGLGIGHTHYPSPPHTPLTPLLMGKWVLFAGAMALCTLAFIALTHRIKKGFENKGIPLPWRMFCGGLAVVGLWQLVGSDRYLGLGVPTIVEAFSNADLSPSTFALKLLFTAITLGAGFLGGEVTPLFFIGATLAGVGLAAVFAAAANAPLALAIMAVELLGAAVLPHVFIVCVLTYVFTGHRGIYVTQVLRRSKLGAPLAVPVRLNGEVVAPDSPDRGADPPIASPARAE